MPCRPGYCGCQRHRILTEEGTLQVKRSSGRSKVKVTADGTGVVSLAGSVLLVEMAEALGLRDGLSYAMAYASAPLITRSRPRARAWKAGVRPGWIVLDFDATLLTAHSEKETGRAHLEARLRVPPFCVPGWDQRGASGMLRPRNAGSGTPPVTWPCSTRLWSDCR
jgi:hypothetical protein